MNWLRWHHGTAMDPKWRVISKKSGVPIVIVISIWATMLESASENEERGVLSGWEPDEIAAGLDVSMDEVMAVYQAMQGKTLDDNRLISWEKRNPKREREDNSTERVQRHREQTSTVKRHVTPRNATKRPEERREEEKREEEKNTEAPLAFCVTDLDFQERWRKYPNPVKRKDAFRHFKASVKNPDDLAALDAALENYITTRTKQNLRRQERGESETAWQNGSTWFNDWQSWIPQVEPDNKHPPHRCHYCATEHTWVCEDVDFCGLSVDLACPTFIANRQQRMVTQ